MQLKTKNQLDSKWLRIKNHMPTHQWWAKRAAQSGREAMAQPPGCPPFTCRAYTWMRLRNRATFLTVTTLLGGTVMRCLVTAQRYDRFKCYVLCLVAWRRWRKYYTNEMSLVFEGLKGRSLVRFVCGAISLLHMMLFTSRYNDLLNKLDTLFKLVI